MCLLLLPSLYLITTGYLVSCQSTTANDNRPRDQNQYWTSNLDRVTWMLSKLEKKFDQQQQQNIAELFKQNQIIEQVREKIIEQHQEFVLLNQTLNQDRNSIVLVSNAVDQLSQLIRQVNEKVDLHNHEIVSLNQSIYREKNATVQLGHVIDQQSRVVRRVSDEVDKQHQATVYFNQTVVQFGSSLEQQQETLHQVNNQLRGKRFQLSL